MYSQLMTSNFSMGAITGLGVGICIGFFLRRAVFRTLISKSNLQAESKEISLDDAAASDECKLVLVVRNDLKMGKGKAAAQCSHASVMAYRQVGKKDPNLLKLWYLSGQRKVVLKVEDESTLLKLKKDAAQAGLLTSIV